MNQPSYQSVFSFNPKESRSLQIENTHWHILVALLRPTLKAEWWQRSPIIIIFLLEEYLDFPLIMRNTLLLSSHAELWNPNDDAKTYFRRIYCIFNYFKTKSYVYIYLCFPPLLHTLVDCFHFTFSLCLPLYAAVRRAQSTDGTRKSGRSVWEVRSPLLNPHTTPSKAPVKAGDSESRMEEREVRFYHWGNCSNVPCPEGR